MREREREREKERKREREREREIKIEMQRIKDKKTLSDHNLAVYVIVRLRRKTERGVVIFTEQNLVINNMANSSKNLLFTKREKKNRLNNTIETRTN